MAGTQRTRAELFEDFDAPFQTGNVPTNADCQDLGASFQHFADPLHWPVSVAVMSGDESVLASSPATVLERDTNGAARSLTPSGSFGAGRVLVVLNVGAQILTFDPSGVNAAIAAGGRGWFLFNGAAWRRVL